MSWTMLDAADMSHIVHPVYLLIMGFNIARALFTSSSSLVWRNSVTDTRLLVVAQTRWCWLTRMLAVANCISASHSDVSSPSNP
jgi:hypothetical protein